MSSPIDSDHIAFLIADIARHFRIAFEHDIAKSEIGVTASEARVLAQLARAGATRQVSLADSMCLAPMSLSVFLDRLEAQGLVRRQADPSDRRAKLVALTPEADPILQRMAEMGQQVSAIALDGLDEAGQQRFAEAAKTIRRNLEVHRGVKPLRMEVEP
ncbi:MarR family winged helix-turn-helix transcriptional regulator [Sulfitobacter aestuarii]|uniref:MarR family winged helix-turn-helix transcriptional regulator n=1 Tax=Sulfitobacter aestuarii TaxID=2161676 RepID=A0ABW5U473_9RHOB